MRTRIVLAVGVLALLPAVAGASGSPPDPPPSDVATLPIGLTESIDLWPYTGTNFFSVQPSDPVNLFFRNADPRAIRQALMRLGGDRTTPIYPGGPSFPPGPPFDCTWADAMGYEQTSWADIELWVGSEIQLACIHPGAPLGDPFRVHLRLFRQGDHTVGAAHFEILAPKTADHQVLSWNFARDFVVFDMLRTGWTPLPLYSTPTPGFPTRFRSILWLIYEGLAGDPQGQALLGLLGLVPPQLDAAGNVWIPLDQAVAVLSPDLVYDPTPEQIRTKFAAEYDVVAPKPFCNTGSDYVRLQGRLHLDLRVYGDEAGRFLRKYDVKGQLRVTPWNPIDNVPLGHPSPARIRERHTAVLTDSHGQLYERASQELLGQQKQSLFWLLAAGELDRYFVDVQCGW